MITSSVRRCSLQWFRATRIGDIVNKFTGQLMLATTVPSVEGSFNRRLKSTAISSDLNSAKQTYCWDDEIPQMKAAWKDIMHDLTEAGPYQFLPETTKYLAEVLNYNVPGGSGRRYLTLVNAYKNIAPPDQLTEENLRLARMLGWCCEMCIGGFWIYDDVIDNAETRRSRPSWHVKTGLVKNAATYSNVVMYCSLELIRRHFKGHPCYEELFETIHQAGIKDPETLRQAELITTEIGRFFQIQNDYLDCYGGSELKTQTDIAKGEFAWPIAAALRQVTPEQRKILDECYGENDPEKVAKVMQLYDELGMPMIYAICEDQSYNLVNFYIEQLTCGLPRDVFFMLRDNVYGVGAERPQLIK